MTFRIVVALLALCLVRSAEASTMDEPGTDIAARRAKEVHAFVNVRVVSMKPGAFPRIKKRQTVIVEDGEIVRIGKAKKVPIPDGAQVIAGKGKTYLLPGLFDMHAHGAELSLVPERFTPEDLYTFYFANGITGIYDPWGFPEIFRWRREILRGKVVGPEVHFTSPGVNDQTHASADAVEQSVREWVQQGYETIKTHSDISEDKFRRLHAIARELNVPVVGHALRPGFPIQATLAEGQRMIAHIEEILSTSVPFDRPENFRQDLATPLRDVANSRVWVTGTVGTYETIVKTVDDETFAELLARPEMRYLPPSVREFWENENRYRQDDFLQDQAFWARLLEVKLYIAREIKNLEALDRLLLGSDSSVPLIVPGFAIHDELRLLVRAGLTPWEAILTGTYNAAAFLGIEDSLGTVEVGKGANLVLVKKNPLKRIGNLRNVAGVMVNDTWLSDEELTARLDELASRFSSPDGGNP